MGRGNHTKILVSYFIGNFDQVMTSYLGDEIIWGWRFDSCVQYDRSRRKFQVDCNKVNSITREEVTPRVSAQHYHAQAE